MKIFICLLVVFFILFFTSDLKLNIKNFEKSKHSAKVKYTANLGVYLFGFIKIFGINFREDGIHFLFFKMPYKKIRIDKNNIKSMKKYTSKDNFKYLNIKIEKMNLKLNIGVEDIIATVFFVYTISMILSVLSAKYSTQINMRNYNYEIIPNYNVNTLNFRFSFKISEKIVNLTKTFLLFSKIRNHPNTHLKPQLYNVSCINQKYCKKCHD